MPFRHPTTNTAFVFAALAVAVKKMWVELPAALNAVAVGLGFQERQKIPHLIHTNAEQIRQVERYIR
jgi:hypothetical protein